MAKIIASTNPGEYLVQMSAQEILASLGEENYSELAKKVGVGFVFEPIKSFEALKRFISAKKGLKTAIDQAKTVAIDLTNIKLPSIQE